MRKDSRVIAGDSAVRAQIKKKGQLSRINV